MLSLGCTEYMQRLCRRGEGRSSRRLRGTGGIELDAAIVHQDPEAAMREIRRLRAAQEARSRTPFFMLGAQRSFPVLPVDSTIQAKMLVAAWCGLPILVDRRWPHLRTPKY